MSIQDHHGVSTGSGDSVAETRSANSGDIAAALGRTPPTPLAAMLGCSRRVTYAPHEVIYHQGSAARCVTFITSGLLKLVVHLPSGRTRIVRFHRCGSILGLGGLLEEVNEHTAVALTPVTALRLPLGAVQRLRQDDPETYISLIERWHGYLKEADIWITQFSTGPIRGRVARLLAFLAGFNRESSSNQVQLLTCDEMGSVLGVTSESTSRILAEFKRKQILVSADDQADDLYAADMGRLHLIAEQA